VNKIVKSGAMLAAGTLLFASQAFAWSEYCGDYTVQLDGLARHGVGSMSFDGHGDVTGIWVMHNAGAPCVENLVGTESEGLIKNGTAINGTLEGNCYKGKVTLDVGPTDDYKGFYFDVTSNPVAQSGTSLLQGDE
jgi:hypothetical protein